MFPPLLLDPPQIRRTERTFYMTVLLCRIIFRKKFEQKRLSQDYYPVRTTGSNQPNNVPMSWHLDQCVNFLLLLKWHFHQKIRSQDWSSHWPRSKQSLEKTEVEWSDSTFAVSFHELDGNCINLYSMYFWPSTILTNSTYLRITLIS